MLLLTDTDQKARCLCGLPLFIGEIEIFPVTVREVIEMGENKYNSYLTILIMPNKIFQGLLEGVSDVNKEAIEQISNFDILTSFCGNHVGLQEDILEAFHFFIKKDIVYDKKKRLFSIVEDDIDIDNDFYDNFIKIIKLQTYLFKADEDAEKPANKKAQEMIEQKKKLKEQVAKLKKRDNEPLSMSDYISIIIAKSYEIDVKKCLDMTVYGFFDYIERQALIDNYDVGIKQILAGEKPEKVNLKHWLSKL